MRGAFGKPSDTVARVNFGQVLISIRTKEVNKAFALEALRRSKYKFPGKQRIYASTKWGFTGVERDEFQSLYDDGKIEASGFHVKHSKNRGKLSDYFSKVMAKKTEV